MKGENIMCGTSKSSLVIVNKGNFLLLISIVLLCIIPSKPANVISNLLLKKECLTASLKSLSDSYFIFFNSM